MEIERMRRFGQCRTFAPGEKLFTAGEVGPGLIVIIAGNVDVSQSDQAGHRTLIVSQGPGQFMGELAQMAGRPSLADATAQGQADALIIPADRLRALLIAEAELGERIMRALI
ncbi:MAG: cyclic nucleotide-binding domain-containing protein, partial [Xanthobacteraceae bacterium]